MNFDAKVRRESFEPVDLFHAHIGGMDAFARGAKIAAAIRKDGVLDDFVKTRYRSFDSASARRSTAARRRSPTAKSTSPKRAKPPERIGSAGVPGECDQHVPVTGAS